MDLINDLSLYLLFYNLYCSNISRLLIIYMSNNWISILRRWRKGIFRKHYSLGKKYEAKQEQETLQRAFLGIPFVIHPVITDDDQTAEELPVS